MKACYTGEMGDDGGYYVKGAKVPKDTVASKDSFGQRSAVKESSIGFDQRSSVNVSKVSHPGVHINSGGTPNKSAFAQITPTKIDAKELSKPSHKAPAQESLKPSVVKPNPAVSSDLSQPVLKSHGQPSETSPLPKAPALGEILKSRGFLSAEQLQKAVDRQKESGELLGQVLVDLGFINSEQMIAALSDQLDVLGGYASQEVPEAEDDGVHPDVHTDAVSIIPGVLAVKAKIMPLSVDPTKKILKVAAGEFRDLQAIDEVRFKTGLELEFVKVSNDFLEECWRKYYQLHSSCATARQNENLINEFRSYTAKLNQDNISAFINKVLIRAAELRVSDIHIDPFEDSVSIRFRMDGRLYQAATFAKSAYQTFMGRLKVIANIEIIDKKTTLDSRIALKISDVRQVQYRISIVNSLFGERVVLRIQRELSDLPSLDQLGVPKLYLDLVRRKLKSPHGMVIVTGPTGSGKTTTLYAMIRELCDQTRNVMTIEDPVELTLPGASQISVDAEKGHTFAKILRGVLRQDPDVIMVGEIRDEETAQIATRAAMTGHLVFCSLHTNDAISSITRLGEMKVPSYYLGPALNLVIAQRLVRVLCDHCKVEARPSRQLLFEMGFSPSQIKRDTFYEPSGCAHCNFTGFKGRTPIFEVLDVRQAVREAIAQGKEMAQIRKIAEKNKYLPFLTLLREYMRRGRTSLDEALPYLIDE